MNRFVCLMGVLLSLPLAAQRKPAPADTRWAGLDAQLEKLRTEWQAAGFAVAVVEKNKVVYLRGFGFRDVEKRLPVTPHTQFAIGSCTKAFTCALLGLLQEQKKLSLGDRAIDHLPALRFQEPAQNQLVTLRDLMTHRTGLPRHDFSWYFFPTASRDSLVKRIAHQTPFAPVREKWHYNNFMFLALGMVAEHHTGKTWEENIRSRFFEPLEMVASTTSIDGLRQGPEAAIGYQVNQGRIERMEYYNIAAMAPAGSINSSVHEMSNWLKMWMRGGQFQGRAVLPASYVKEAIGSHMVVNSEAPEVESPDLHFGNYGYGWFVSSYKGHYRVEHGGNIDGFSANTSFFPTDSLGIVVLVNQNGSVLPSLVRNLISDRALQLKATDWNREFQNRRALAERQQVAARLAVMSARKRHTRPSHALADYTGRYTHPGYGAFELSVVRDSLWARTPLKTFWLKHHHYDVFASYERKRAGIDTSLQSTLLFHFRAGDTGDIQALQVKLEPALDALEFKRVPRLIATTREALKKYEGSYELAGATVRFYLKADDTLYLTVPGQPEYTLLATDTHLFVLKGLDGFRVRFTEQDGKITEATFLQPNGTFVAKRKP